MEFPMGVGGPFGYRPRPVPLGEHVQHLLRIRDGRIVNGLRGHRVVQGLVNTDMVVDASGKILEGEGPVEVTAFEIHRAIHLADPSKYGCVLHTHMSWATALCCIMAETSPGLVLCHQDHLKFYDDWAYDEQYSGLVLDGDEGTRLAGALQGKKALLHRNHGVIVCGATVCEAFEIGAAVGHICPAAVP